tara:strand:- start:2272 stop:2466 length:195 start_codon:yes stop_codon:yes gene_type:complete
MLEYLEIVLLIGILYEIQTHTKKPNKSNQEAASKNSLPTYEPRTKLEKLVESIRKWKERNCGSD